MVYSFLPLAQLLLIGSAIFVFSWPIAFMTPVCRGTLTGILVSASTLTGYIAGTQLHVATPVFLAFLFTPAVVFALAVIISRKKGGKNLGCEPPADLCTNLFSNARELIFQIDNKGTIIEINPACIAVTGYNSDHLIGMTATQLLYKRDIPRAISQLKQLRTSNRTVYGRFRIMTKTGEIRHLEMTLVPFKHSGVLASIYGIARDVSVEHRSLKHVQFLADVITSTKAPIIVLDNEGRIKVWNQGAELLTGIARAHAISNKYSEFFPFAPDFILEVEANDGSYSVELLIPTAYGDIPVSANCYKLVGGNSPKGYAILLQNIERQKQLEEKLQHHQRIEALGKLAGGIAHDFSNLLTIIAGNVAMLRKMTEEDDRRFTYVRGIIRATDRGAKLTNQLLAFGKRRAFNPARFSLKDLVDEMIHLLDHSGWKQVHFETRFEPNLPDLFADQSRMNQVLMNLLINSRDAMPEGGTIAVSVERKDLFGVDLPTVAVAGAGTYLVMTISDDGTGMEQDTLKHLFEPFYTTKGAKGTGLGLATVHGIIQQHKGWIEVESDIGRGSTFRIYLPILDSFSGERGAFYKASDSLPQEDLNAAMEEVSDLPLSAYEPVMKEELYGSETVLLVDDEDLVREVYGSILEMYGYRVMMAADGIEALDIHEREKNEIDIVVLDLIMPGLDGGQVAMELNKNHPQLPILLQSGLQPPAMPELMHVDSVRAFLRKPFLPEYLLTEMRKILDMVEEAE